MPGMHPTTRVYGKSKGLAKREKTAIMERLIVEVTKPVCLTVSRLDSKWMRYSANRCLFGKFLLYAISLAEMLLGILGEQYLGCRG
jgi:hypothetical protein